MVNPTRTGLILGFHGCEREVGEALIAGRMKMRPSKNGIDWLGPGCYFWENNYERALDFARNPPGKKVIRSPFAIGAVIDLKFCLDLLDTAFLRIARMSYESLLEITGEVKALPVNSPVAKSKDLLLRKLDYQVIENVHTQREKEGLAPFDSVRAVFTEGDPLYPGAGFNEKNHIQLCIRNPNCIKGFFNPAEEARWPLN